MVQLYLTNSEGTTYTNEDFNFIINRKTVPDFPTITLIQDDIPYRRDNVIYQRKCENRIIDIDITFIVDNFAELSENINALNTLLQNKIAIQFAEMGYVYFVNLTGTVGQETISTHTKTYSLTFETTTPYKNGPISNEQLEFGQGFSFGMGLQFMTPTIDYVITGNTTIQVENFGNQPAFPIITIIGTCDNVKIDEMIYNNTITDNLTIDVKKEICYRDNAGTLENKLPYLSGNFLEIIPGTNNIEITGNNLDLTLSLNYRHCYK